MLGDGETVRTFEQADAAGARYVVRMVRTPARELVFDYNAGRLATVSHDGATLFDVERDRDIAGSDWRYLYRDDGLLGGAVDPDDRTYLAADYDAAGRAVRAFGGRLHDYAYAPEGTTVAEDTGEVHTLTRNAAGATTALESTTGVSWSLTLDGANRVSTLTLPDGTIGYAYGGHGKVATMTVADSVSGTTRVHSYDYDAQGRLVAVTGGGADATVVYAAGLVRIDDGGGVFEYEVDDGGRVASVRRGADPEIRVERDDAGDVVEISQAYRSVRFGRDELGRIVDAAFADGNSARYFYDDLGSRRLTEHGDGRIIEYSHDAAGNLAGMVTRDRLGGEREWTVTAPGTWLGLGIGVETFAVQRGLLLTVVEAGHTSVGVARDRPATGLAETQPRDGRLAVLMGDHGRDSQPHNGVLVSGSDLKAGVREPLAADVPKAGDVRALLELAAALHGDGAVDSFERLADLVFLPTEMLHGEAVRVVAERSTDGGSCASCATDSADAAARAELTTYEQEAFERSFRMTCSGTQAHIGGRRSSEGIDPCRVAIAASDDAIAYGHSHPYFTNYPQLNKWQGCFGEKSWGRGDDVTKNRENRIFSDNDRHFAKNEVGLPFYLITPDRRTVKVYRKNAGGRWQSEDI